MENEKLTYINSRGERLELGVDSVYHCNISKDVEGISGVTSVIYSTNSMGQHGDTYVGQRIEARDIDVVGHINTRDKAQALELRRRMLKIFNPELSATLVYEYGGFKRVIDCRAYGEPNERERLFGFYLYKGNDLTATNTEGNTPCIFSRDFDNVNEQEYTASIENCGNFIYVQGAADDDGSQPVTTVDGEGATGLDLVEVFCDATDIARKYQQGETEVTIPLNTYIAMLKTRGSAELENYGKNINFVSTINTNSNLKFKADFDLGDRITCKETKWGIQIDARITEVTETYQKGEETIEATFGDSLPTLVDQIRKVR